MLVHKREHMADQRVHGRNKDQRQGSEVLEHFQKPVLRHKLARGVLKILLRLPFQIRVMLLDVFVDLILCDPFLALAVVSLMPWSSCSAYLRIRDS